MDYFQGVVTEFLRADRAAFVNTEYLIQLETGDAPAKGRHWYCDAVVANFRQRTVYLCEITYSKSMVALLGRLEAWALHWEAIRKALTRDSGIPPEWHVQPWIFVPKANEIRFQERLDRALQVLTGEIRMPPPRVTCLESVTPWNYRSWNRTDDALSGGGF